MFRLLTLFIYSLFFCLINTAVAQTQRVVLNIQGEFQSGEILDLKKLIEQQRNVDLRNYDVESVNLLSKSYQGRGVIALQSGREQTRSGFIPGNPRDYRDPYPSTFHSIALQVRNPDPKANLLLSFQGRIYVQNITVRLRYLRNGPTPPRNRYPQPIQFTAQGEFRLDKFIESSKNTRLRLNNVKVIRLVALKNDAQISQARVILSNGQEVFLDSLTGRLAKDRYAQFTFPNFNGVNVESIYLSGTTSSLIGSRANLKVEIGLLRY